jgi:hypothetical protein
VFVFLFALNFFVIMGCGFSSCSHDLKASSFKEAARETRATTISNEDKIRDDDAISSCVAPFAISLKTGPGLYNKKIGEGSRTTKMKELLKNSDKSTDILKMSRAAILIQRVARGKSARESTLQRKNSAMAEQSFLKSIDPYLSPAENASKSLLDLALVKKVFFP